MGDLINHSDMDGIQYELPNILQFPSVSLWRWRCARNFYHHLLQPYHGNHQHQQPRPPSSSLLNLLQTSLPFLGCLAEKKSIIDTVHQFDQSTQVMQYLQRWQNNRDCMHECAQNMSGKCGDVKKGQLHFWTCDTFSCGHLGSHQSRFDGGF